MAKLEGVPLGIFKYVRGLFNSSAVRAEEAAARHEAPLLRETLDEPLADEATAAEQRTYGPFHREETRTQSAKTARQQQESSEIWGRTPRRGYTETVQAYHGPLPDGVRGIEFYSHHPPREMNGPMAQWYSGMDGVRVEDGYAKINVVVTRNTQV